MRTVRLTRVAMYFYLFTLSSILLLGFSAFVADKHTLDCQPTS